MTESEKLITAYEKTRDKLTEKLKTAATASTKQYYKKMLEDIDNAIKELSGSASRYVGAAVPLEYLQNAQQIYSSVRAQGIQMQPPAAFKQQHSDAVADLRREVQSQLEKGVVKAQEQSAALAADTYKATLRKIGLDAAQQKVDTVGTISDMQNDVKKRLEDEGILKVNVGSGEKAREMSITNYANLVARSTSREVGNTARINQLELNGFDLVEIPEHYPTCEICAILQNRIYSISGKDKRFPPLSRAFSGGYKNIHPHCRHVLVAWIESMHTPEEVEEAIKNSNRSWEDPRTGEEVKFYNDLQTKARCARDLRAQYERYKERLGEDAIKSFYSFKRIKKADGEKWAELQRIYKDKGIIDNAINNGIIKTDKQFGKKIGKHAEDFGLDASSEADREKMNAIIDDIYYNKDETRIGKWTGQQSDVIFYAKGADVVITKKNGEFVTILKGGITSGRFKDARRIKI